MKKLAIVIAAIALIGTPAHAANMAVKAPPPPPTAPVYSWTGWYVGGNIGGGWGHRDVTFTPNDPAASLFFLTAPPPSPSFDINGVVGGLQLGYNWQFQPTWLVGFETDFDWSGMKGSSAVTTVVSGISSCINDSCTSPLGSWPVDEHIRWFGTVRGRFGWLPSDNLLVYGTGGFAYGRVEHTGNFTLGPGFEFAAGSGGFSFNCGSIAGGANPCFAGSSGSTEIGWTAGGGLEWAFSPHWSLKGEYLFVSLHDNSLTETAQAVLNPGNTLASFNANFNHTNFNVLRVGLNYQFH